MKNRTEMNNSVGLAGVHTVLFMWLMNVLCTHCNKNELGDDFHYILDCPFFEQDWNIYIPKYYYSRPYVLKYKLLFSSKKKSELIKLSKFINHINKTVCTPA
jgi:hypothetical protein